MKKVILFIVYGVLSANLSLAQDVAINPEFFTTKNMRIGLSLGAESAIGFETNDTRKLLWVSQQGTTPKDYFTYDKPAVNTSFNLGIDVYSPNSALGFFAEFNYNTLKYQITPDDGAVIDSISSVNFEIPVYLKFRLGKVNRSGHTWLALGGGYSIVSKARQNTTRNNTRIGEQSQKSFLSNIGYTSAILGREVIIAGEGSNGEEIYDRDTFRALIYLKVNYDLSSRINGDFDFNTGSVLGSISNLDVRLLRVSIGIKLLFRVSTLGKLAGSALLLK